MAVYEKLGGDNEASRMMGKATQAVASHFAAQPQIDAVSFCLNNKSGMPCDWQGPVKLSNAQRTWSDFHL